MPIKKIIFLLSLFATSTFAADTPVSCQGASCKVVVKTRDGSNAAQTAAQFQSELTTGVLHSDSSGNVTSSTVVNADVDASAAIAGSKLQAASASNAGAVTTGVQTIAGNKTWNGMQSFPAGTTNSNTYAVAGAGVGTGITFFRSAGHYLNLYEQAASNGNSCDAACAGSAPAGVCIGAANTTAGVTCANNSSSRACLCVTVATSP